MIKFLWLDILKWKAFSGWVGLFPGDAGRRTKESSQGKGGELVVFVNDRVTLGSSWLKNSLWTISHYREAVLFTEGIITLSWQWCMLSPLQHWPNLQRLPQTGCRHKTCMPSSFFLVTLIMSLCPPLCPHSVNILHATPETIKYWIHFMHNTTETSPSPGKIWSVPSGPPACIQTFCTGRQLSLNAGPTRLVRLWRTVLIQLHGKNFVMLIRRFDQSSAPPFVQPSLLQLLKSSAASVHCPTPTYHPLPTTFSSQHCIGNAVAVHPLHLLYSALPPTPNLQHTTPLPWSVLHSKLANKETQQD